MITKKKKKLQIKLILTPPKVKKTLPILGINTIKLANDQNRLLKKKVKANLR